MNAGSFVVWFVWNFNTKTKLLLWVLWVGSIVMFFGSLAFRVLFIREYLGVLY